MPTLAADAVEIANVKARYCAASDLCPTDIQAALAGFRTAFTKDVVGDYGFKTFHGFDELTGFMTTAVAGNSEWMVHMLHTPRIEVDGDSATGNWTVMGQMKRREGGEIDTVLGRYSDELVRTPEGWRIAKVTFTRYS
jgi:SnoaL-like domain